MRFKRALATVAVVIAGSAGTGLVLSAPAQAVGGGVEVRQLDKRDCYATMTGSWCTYQYKVIGSYTSNSYTTAADQAESLAQGRMDTLRRGEVTNTYHFDSGSFHCVDQNPATWAWEGPGTCYQEFVFTVTK